MYNVLPRHYVHNTYISFAKKNSSNMYLIVDIIQINLHKILRITTFLNFKMYN